MSLYHSGVSPEIQSKATRVITRAKIAMKAGANLRARALKPGPRGVLLQGAAHQHRQAQDAEAEGNQVRTEKKGRLSQKAFAGEDGMWAASGREPG